MNKYFEDNTGLNVGDLVRFKDISSGNNMFPFFDGCVGLLTQFSTCQSGNPMATVVMRGRKETFNVHYFEAINESR